VDTGVGSFLCLQGFEGNLRPPSIYTEDRTPPAHGVLGREGHVVNRKKIQRLWREEGQRVPARRRKRQRLGHSTTPARRLQAERPDHQFDVTANGRVIKLLHVVDEFTRESLADLVDHSVDADATVACLDKIVGVRMYETHKRG
jgi:putative transposase